MPTTTSGTRAHPSRATAGCVTAARAVAPAGGWTVSVRPVARRVRAVARAPAGHFGGAVVVVLWEEVVVVVEEEEEEEERGEGEKGEREGGKKILLTATPMMLDRKCPTRALRGWARGESMAWNSRTAVAPCGVEKEKEVSVRRKGEGLLGKKDDTLERGRERGGGAELSQVGRGKGTNSQN